MPLKAERGHRVPWWLWAGSSSPSCLRTLVHTARFNLSLGASQSPKGLHLFLHTSHSTWGKCTYWHWILSKEASPRTLLCKSTDLVSLSKEKGKSYLQPKRDCFVRRAHTCGLDIKFSHSQEFPSCLNKVKPSICINSNPREGLRDVPSTCFLALSWFWAWLGMHLLKNDIESSGLKKWVL